VMHNCLLTMKKVKEEGIELNDKVQISCQDVINRASSDPPFRTEIVVSTDKIIKFFGYQMDTKDMRQIDNLTGMMKQDIRSRLKNFCTKHAEKTSKDENVNKIIIENN